MSPSVIIGDLDIMRSVSLPDKTDPPLIVDPDAMLTSPAPLQLLQPITGRGQKIFEGSGIIEHRKLPFRDGLETGERFDGLA